MNELNYRVSLLMLCVLALALILVGVCYGFGAFVLASAGFALATWLWHRCVVCRPRVQAVGAYVGEFLGDRYYLMEVA